MGIKITIHFGKRSYHYGSHYIRELEMLQVRDKKFVVWADSAGRGTYLAKAIEFYCIKRKFLSGKKRKISVSLTEDRLKLLKFMCQVRHYPIFKKALEEKWSEEKLKGKLFWKVL